MIMCLSLRHFSYSKLILFKESDPPNQAYSFKNGGDKYYNLTKLNFMKSVYSFFKMSLSCTLNSNN